MSSETMTRGEIAKKIALRFFEILCDDSIDSDRMLVDIWNTINPNSDEDWTEYRGNFTKMEY